MNKKDADFHVEVSNIHLSHKKKPHESYPENLVSKSKCFPNAWDRISRSLAFGSPFHFWLPRLYHRRFSGFNPELTEVHLHNRRFLFSSM